MAFSSTRPRIKGLGCPLLDAMAGGRSNTRPPSGGQVAQLVEQRTENPRVGGSIPPLATTFRTALLRACHVGRVGCDDRDR